MIIINLKKESYQNATKMSVKVSMAEKAAKTIQYIIHLTYSPTFLVLTALYEV